MRFGVSNGRFWSLLVALVACQAEPSGGSAAPDAAIDVANGDVLTQEASADATNDATDGPDEAGQCGDPSLLPQYELCKQAKTESECVAAGGSWEVVGYNYTELCMCPTPDANCPCMTYTDCVSNFCILESSLCKDALEGLCYETNQPIGCFCFFDDGLPGSDDFWCID